MYGFIGQGTIDLVGFLGAVVMLLWGVKLVRYGVESILGVYMHSLVSVLKIGVYGLLAGILFATILQSSTALVLIVAAVSIRGALSLPVALRVVLGADVGTAIAAQVLAFDIKAIAPLILIAGFVLNSSKNKNVSKSGQIMLGLSLILHALGLISVVAGNIQDSEVIKMIVSSLSSDMMLTILFAVIITWIFHSSLAVVLMTVELAASGLLPIGVSVLMVLGANLGACLPAFINSLGSPLAARRLTFGNVLFRVSGFIIAVPFMGFVVNWAENTAISPARFLVNFHLIFNVAVALTFIFFTKQVASLIYRVFPEKEQPITDSSKTKFLSKIDKNNPDLAIRNLTKETERLSNNIYAMLHNSSKIFDSKEIAGIIQTAEDNVDHQYKGISLYLQKLYRLHLDREQNIKLMLSHIYATNMEQMADVMSSNISDLAHDKHKKSLTFSVEAKMSIDNVYRKLLDNLFLSQRLFEQETQEIAKELAENKKSLNNYIGKVSMEHTRRVLAGEPLSTATNTIFLDLMRDLKRLNSHIASIAYPIFNMDSMISEFLRQSDDEDIEDEMEEEKTDQNNT